MEKNFAIFISKCWDRKSPLLLGLSGGPDSLCLYHLLLRAKLPFEVAHVNHRWRKESDEEAMILRKMCQVPFHEKILTPPEKKKNLEEGGRIERLRFFKEVVNEIKAQAVLLGHQADDQAETVLKRVFEGAGLCQLKGLSYVSTNKGLEIWRPLLSHRKEEILQWLQGQNLTWFQDQTNDDRLFLRGRLRQDILPFLSQNFGKEVTPSLVRLGKLSLELSEFVSSIILPYLGNMKEQTIDFSLLEPKTQFEWKVVLHAFFEKMNLTLSMPHLESIIAHLKKGAGCKEVNIKDKKVVIQKKTLMVTKR